MKVYYGLLARVGGGQNHSLAQKEKQMLKKLKKINNGNFTRSDAIGGWGGAMACWWRYLGGLGGTWEGLGRAVGGRT